MAELLDAFREDASRLVPVLKESRIANLPLRLLEQGLEVFGESLEPSRLYHWLNATGSPRPVPPGSRGPSTRVREWLEARPDVQTAVFLVWLQRRIPDDADLYYGYRLCDALHKSKLPPDFGLRCLDTAAEIGEAEPAVSQNLLRQAHASLGQPSVNQGLTLELKELRQRLGKDLTPDEARKIDVIVLDVTKPGDQP